MAVDAFSWAVPTPFSSDKMAVVGRRPAYSWSHHKKPLRRVTVIEYFTF